ncbi:MAG: FAD-dependent oxidoreductase [Clostridia bacterium]|nr:FAD-dependent oxidoreductase [Clostridia bacterium]
MKYDVAIIGAGVVGALTARELMKYKLRVCVLEAKDDVALGASRANSGIVHGGFDPVEGTLKAKLNVAGTRIMKSLVKELDVHYKQNGSMVLAFCEEEKEHLQKLYDRGIANGVPELSIISGDEARAMEPALSENVVAALLCESSGIVCPYDLTIAAMGNAMDNGAELLCNFPVTGIEYADGVYTVKSAEKAVEATYVINSAGVGADEIADMIGDKYTITPKKGEYMLLDRSEGPLVSHTIFQTPGVFVKGILVSPTADGNLLVGPTSELTEKGDLTTTLAGLDKIKAIAARSTEKVNYRKVITSFTGLRSSCADSEDFIIEFSKNAPKFIELIGIESPGLSSAPAIAEYVAEMLKADGLAMEANEAFNPTRVSCRHFGTLSMAEKNEMIKADPAFGHLICRCETVTEGEILAAIRQNPPARSLDAVKRRTRAGMGRCQGGFCTTFITELLAKEQGIPETKVTKFGGKSYMLCGKTK